MSNFTSHDMARLQAYMQSKFGHKGLTVRSRGKATDSVEVLMDGEFIGTVYKDEEDGDTSFDFNMAILAADLAA